MADAYYRYQWKGENPDLVIGYDFGVRAVDADDVSGVDLIPAGTNPATHPAEAALGDQQVFKFPPGQYRITFNAIHRVSLDSTLGAWILCVDSSTDILKQYYASGRASIQESPLGPTHIAETDRLAQGIELTRLLNLSDETFITIIGGSFGDNNAVDGIHSMIIEKL